MNTTGKINSIFIEDNSTEYKSFGFNGNEDDTINGLGKINLFIGTNNSGKSRLIRKLFNTSIKFKGDPSLIHTDEYVSYIKKFIELVDEHKFKTVLKSGQDILPLIRNITNGNATLIEGTAVAEHHVEITSLSDPSNLTGLDSHNQHRNLSSLTPSLNEFSRSIGKDKNFIVTEISKKEPLQKIYIPSLRGLRIIGNDVNTDFYLARTKMDYFGNANLDKNKEIFTGQTMYEDFKKLLLGTHQQRENARNFENFLRNEFFENNDVTITPSYDTDHLMIKIGDKDDFPIHDLGDGIQSIICITFPFFRDKEKKIIGFIEEPETNLHPGMQKILIKTLSKEFPNHQFFITTHSNNFLDRTLELDNISTYRARKSADSITEIHQKSTGDHSLLESIGVSNSSVMITNCTIWVEGITDRIYIQKYLDLLLESNTELKKIHEDLHYSFVEYSGGNVTHWSFSPGEDGINVEPLCGKLVLIADNDSATKKKRIRLDHLKSELGDRFIEIPCREIENLISPKILHKTACELLGVEERNVPMEYTQKDYTKGYMGTFLNKVYNSNLGKGTTNKVTFTDKKLKPGTINNKLGFCKTATNKMTTFEDLSVDAQKLVKDIYQFVMDNNT